MPSTSSAKSRRKSFGTPVPLKINTTTDGELENMELFIESPAKKSNGGRRSIGGARRRSFGTILQAGAVEERPMSDEDKAALKEMYSNVIKMSTENKITSKNAWSLNVLDNMETFVDEPDESMHSSGTRSINFQRASCTLDASVKIYSCRVDDTHQASFRVLENLTRNGKREDDGSDAPSGNACVGDKTTSRKFCLTKTLEKNPAALNASKMDQTSTVDPLFHKMSQLFDGGGAYGMLLVNMSLSPDSQGCCIAFGDDDYSHAGDHCEGDEESAADDMSNALDEIGAAIAHSYQGVASMELCPQIRELRDELVRDGDDDAQGVIDPPDDDGYVTEDDDDSNCPEDEQTDDFCLEGFTDFNDEADDDPAAGVDETTTSHHQLNHHFLDSICSNAMMDSEYSFFDKARLSSVNQWAGAKHWKFTRVKPISAAGAGGGPMSAKKEDSAPDKKKSRPRKERFSIDFTADDPSTDDQQALMISGGKTIALSEAVLKKHAKGTSDISLPVDSGVGLEDLGRLFLRPSAVLSLCRKESLSSNHFLVGQGMSSSSMGNNMDMMDNDGDMCAYDDNDDDGDDDGHTGFDGLVPSTPFDYDRSKMAAPTRLVNQIDVKYARVAKRVDVRKLKTDLWGQITDSFRNGLGDKAEIEDEEAEAVREAEEPVSDNQSSSLSFKEVMGDVEAVQGQSGTSLAFYFICVLHLANEKNLSLEGTGNLDDMVIQHGESCTNVC